MNAELLDLSRAVSNLPGHPEQPKKCTTWHGSWVLTDIGCRWNADPDEPEVWLLDLDHAGTGGVCLDALDGTLKVVKEDLPSGSRCKIVHVSDDATTYATVFKSTLAAACALVAKHRGDWNCNAPR